MSDIIFIIILVVIIIIVIHYDNKAVKNVLPVGWGLCP